MSANVKKVHDMGNLCTCRSQAHTYIVDANCAGCSGQKFARSVKLAPNACTYTYTSHPLIPYLSQPQAHACCVEEHAVLGPRFESSRSAVQLANSETRLGRDEQWHTHTPMQRLALFSQKIF